jgi:carboxymethylenebutenolidase
MEQNNIRPLDHGPAASESRRQFVGKLKHLAVTTAVAPFLWQLEENAAQATSIYPIKMFLDVNDIEIAPDIKGQLSKPKNTNQKLPGLLVVHENLGLTPAVREVANQLAFHGFLTFAPDYLTSLGGTPAGTDADRDLISGLNLAEVRTTSLKVRAALAARENVNGKVAAIGYGWGGDQVNALAVADPDLAAGVVYCGSQPALTDVPKIKAPLLLHYGSLDDRVKTQIVDFEMALKANNKNYELYIYEGANRGFENFMNKAQYNPEAMQLSWERTSEFLKKYTALET